MDYSFLAARLSFTFMYTCIFFSWQINSAAAVSIRRLSSGHVTVKYLQIKRAKKIRWLHSFMRLSTVEISVANDFSTPRTRPSRPSTEESFPAHGDSGFSILTSMAGRRRSDLVQTLCLRVYLPHNHQSIKNTTWLSSTCPLSTDPFPVSPDVGTCDRLIRQFDFLRGRVSI